MNDRGVALVGALAVLAYPLLPVAGAVARGLPWRGLAATIRHANPRRV